MGTYLLFGKYSTKSIKKISAERTGAAEKVIQDHGGVFHSGYALLGDIDLVLVVDFPDNEKAMQASVALTKMLGIAFNTKPAVSVADFDQLLG